MGRWPEPTYNLASFRIQRVQKQQWWYTMIICSHLLLHVSTGNSSIGYPGANRKPWEDEVHLLDYLSSPETIFPKSWMKATRHQKDDPLQMKYPHCKMPYTALHICSVATTLFFPPKRGPRKHESEEYHPWPCKRWRGLPSATCIMVVTVNGLDN
jgi:hypothetical protein